MERMGGRASKSEHVAQRILDRIVSARLEKGASLGTEADLVQEFKVSRPTLRESLRMLEMQGVLLLKPGPKGGIIVSKPGVDILAHGLSVYLRMHEVPLAETLSALAVMEPGLAAAAVENATAADIAAMAASIERMRQIRDSAAFIEENLAFHAMVACSCGNPVMEIFWSSLTAMAAAEMRDMRLTAAQRQSILEAHAAILSACRAGDSVAAHEAMRAHVAEIETPVVVGRQAGRRRAG